ncbi:MAG: YraN family protein [Spirochaetales bacterium]|nr:YraN family protein [Spirochaetales bacterium]MBR2316597.1 YraN family protein [Spirochaetales bacterium]
MKTQNNTEIGKRGEEIAAEFLKKQGVDIIEKNYHTKFGEIDLIGFDKSTIIFIEVKLRNNDNFGTPVEAITQTKLKRIYKSALWYISMHKNNYDYRFDVIAIRKDNINRCYHLEWFKNQNLIDLF